MTNQLTDLELSGVVPASIPVEPLEQTTVIPSEIQHGDAVRAYGVPGIRGVDGEPELLGDVWVVKLGGACGFSVPLSSIVELNGHRRTLGSLPLSPPASDYPYDSTLCRPEPGYEGRKLPESWAIEMIA